MRGGATFSPCGTYRYQLTRRWRPGPRIVAWVMLNPSTADAHQDDPTIRRVIGFSITAGFDALVVVNLFAFRATHPSLLAAATDPVGPANTSFILRAIARADSVVAAWGAHPLAARGSAVIGSESLCLGTTQSGAPRHPLYVRGDTPLVRLPADGGTSGTSVA